MKPLLILLFSLSFFFCAGQQLTTSTPIPLPLPEKVTIKKVIRVGKDFCGVGNIREGADLNVYLFKFSEEGKILLEKRMGDSNSFDDIANIIEISGTYWVLFNVLKDNKKVITLHHLDQNFEIIHSIDLSHPKRERAVGLSKISENEIAIAINYTMELGTYYPLVLKFNTATEQIDSASLEYNNPSKETTSVDVSSMPEGMKKLHFDTMNQLLKSAMNIISINQKTFIVGCENTENVSDFWAACIDENHKLAWEKLYEKNDDVGGDFLVNAQEASDGQTALFGQHYDKKNNLDYNYSFMLVNSKGEVQIEKRYTLGFDEQLNCGLKFGNNFLLCGYVDEEPVKKGWIGNNIQDVNLWYVLINEKGEKITATYPKMKGYQKLISATKATENQSLSLYEQTESGNNGYYILMTKIEN